MRSRLLPRALLGVVAGSHKRGHMLGARPSSPPAWMWVKRSSQGSPPRAGGQGHYPKPPNRQHRRLQARGDGGNIKSAREGAPGAPWCPGGCAHCRRPVATTQGRRRPPSCHLSAGQPGPGGILPFRVSNCTRKWKRRASSPCCAMGGAGDGPCWWGRTQPGTRPQPALGAQTAGPFLPGDSQRSHKAQ